MSRRVSFAGLIAAAWLAGCGTMAVAPNLAALPPPPAHPNGGILWKLVDTKCVPGELAHHDPKPCAAVSLAGGRANGYALLKDKVGVAQYLLMPTIQAGGIEDPKLLAVGVPNYFALAWNARSFVQSRLADPLPTDETSIAVNSQYGRTQDLLHLHIDCLDPAIRDALAAAGPHIGTAWSREPKRLGDHDYYLRRIPADALAAENPFQLLAADMPGAAQQMAAWTLALVGAAAHDRAGGWYLLAGRADPAVDNTGSAEAIQDHACKAHRPAA